MCVIPIIFLGCDSKLLDSHFLHSKEMAILNVQYFPLPHHLIPLNNVIPYLITSSPHHLEQCYPLPHHLIPSSPHHLIPLNNVIPYLITSPP